MIEIQINPSLQPPIETDHLEHALVNVLRYTQAPAQAGVTLVLTDDAQLQQLNLDFLGIDAPTDVLAFPAGDTDPETGQVYLGDVVISVPRAVEQAAEHDHSPAAELLLLAVHGMLHLLGYDHADDAERMRMWAAQDEILAGCE